MCIYAVHKKKSVSCPAGGQNCVKSGGRILYFLSHYFFFLLENIVHFCGCFFFLAKMKKKVSSRIFFLVTRPLNRKHNYFYGQPYSLDPEDGVV